MVTYIMSIVGGVMRDLQSLAVLWVDDIIFAISGNDVIFIEVESV